MKENLKQIIGTLVLGVGLTMFTGCAAVGLGAGAAAGAGAATYVRGDLRQNVDAPIDRCDDAANKALQDLRLNKVSEEKSLGSSKIIARDAKDRKVVINMRKLTDQSTTLAVRVGTWGDRTDSQEILKAIDRHAGISEPNHGAQPSE